MPELCKSWAHMGLPQLELDASGSCALEFDQRLMVNFNTARKNRSFGCTATWAHPCWATQVYEDLLQPIYSGAPQQGQR